MRLDAQVEAPLLPESRESIRWIVRLEELVGGSQAALDGDVINVDRHDTYIDWSFDAGERLRAALVALYPLPG